MDQHNAKVISYPPHAVIDLDTGEDLKHQGLIFVCSVAPVSWDN